MSIEQNDWIALHMEDLQEGWSDWAHKETEVFFDFLDFAEFCYANQGKDFQAEYKRRVRRGVGLRGAA